MSFNLAVLRQFVPHDRLTRFWLRTEGGRPGGACPSCANAMSLVTIEQSGRALELDACRRCQLLWFDADELAAFSPEHQAPPPQPPEKLSPRAAEALVGALPGAEELGDKAITQANEILFLLATLVQGI